MPAQIIISIIYWNNWVIIGLANDLLSVGSVMRQPIIYANAKVSPEYATKQ